MASEASRQRARALFARTAYPKRYREIVSAHRKLTSNLHRIRTPVARGRLAGIKAESLASLRNPNHPMGTTSIKRGLLVEPKSPKGAKFQKRISPGAHSTRFKKRLSIRRKRMGGIKSWSRGRRIKPI